MDEDEVTGETSNDTKQKESTRFQARFYNESRIPMLERSCCGCSLETGTKIIGFIVAITNMLAVIFYFIALVYFASISHRDAITFQVVVNILYLFQSLMAVYLLVGVYKKKAFYIKTWVVIQAAFLIISLITILIFLIYLMMGNFMSDLIIEIVEFVAETYAVLLVYSYYRSVRPGNFENEA